MLGLLLTACGGSSSGTLVLQPARTFRLSGFQPLGAVGARKSTLVSFTIKQPSGAALTTYKTGSGPHTGVDLIIVRSDLCVLLYEDTDIGADGRITQPVTFPSPGRYRIIVDAYPTQTGAGRARHATSSYSPRSACAE